MECIWIVSKYREKVENGSPQLTVELGGIERYMKLDSPAADAVNLLPKPDHPSVFGSIYGVLNRCKTKLGSRTLDR
jgi:DNA mismatch repair ATPase MutS